jgi:hypothetical protein
VLGPARLHHQLDSGLADREADALAYVVDVDQVGPALADRRQQGRERARLVGDLGEDPQAPAMPGLMVAREIGEDAARIGIYLTDMAEFPKVNDVYATFFEQPFPLRTTVGVAALPKGALVEMDATVPLFT